MEYVIFVATSVAIMALLGMAWRAAKRAQRRKGVSPILED